MCPEGPQQAFMKVTCPPFSSVPRGPPLLLSYIQGSAELGEITSFCLKWKLPPTGHCHFPTQPMPLSLILLGGPERLCIRCGSQETAVLGSLCNSAGGWGASGGPLSCLGWLFNIWGKTTPAMFTCLPLATSHGDTFRWQGSE